MVGESKGKRKAGEGREKIEFAIHKINRNKKEVGVKRENQQKIDKPLLVQNYFHSKVIIY